MKNLPGFSLVEITIVICLVALASTLVLTNTSFLQHSFNRAELDKLYMMCLQAQRLAIVKNEPQVITFDDKNHSYSFKEQCQKLSQGIKFGFLPNVYGPPAQPNSLISHAITFKSQKIVFWPEGIMGAGTIYLVDKGNHIMYALTCSVSQVSLLRKYRYTKKWEMV